MCHTKFDLIYSFIYEIYKMTSVDEFKLDICCLVDDSSDEEEEEQYENLSPEEMRGVLKFQNRRIKVLEKKIEKGDFIALLKCALKEQLLKRVIVSNENEYINTFINRCVQKFAS